MKPLTCTIALLSIAVVALADDGAVDWLLNKGTTLPATRASTTQPTTTQTTAARQEPNSPFAKRHLDGYRQATITLSNDKKVDGMIRTTKGRPVRLWDAKIRRYRDLPFSMITKVEAHVVWERDEKEWKFVDAGSDIKEFTGRTYPARQTEFSITLSTGQTHRGAVVAPIYVHQPKGGSDKLYVLHKRAKGALDEKLTDLVYVKSIVFKNADGLSE